MGMYTGIRFKGYVKPQFREDFEGIALSGDWNESNDEVFRTFGQIGRSGFIPCGGLSYMPDEWEVYDESLKGSYDYYRLAKATDGFERTWNKDTGYWTFQCSLKNYEDEIEEWFKIVPYFIDKIEHLEYFYEEWTYSQQYDLVDGKIELINDRFRKYGYED
jgi:hypothetical protein